MKTIWKYPFPVGDAIFSMPQGAKVLSVQAQDGLPTLWVLVDPNAPKESRGFFALHTGWDIYPSIERELGAFVGTVQLDGFVWHIFEALPSAPAAGGKI